MSRCLLDTDILSEIILERWKEAKTEFERMLWLNPSDNQGVRFCLPRVRAREPWTDDEF